MPTAVTFPRLTYCIAFKAEKDEPWAIYHHKHQPLLFLTRKAAKRRATEMHKKREYPDWKYAAARLLYQLVDELHEIYDEQDDD